MSEHGCGRRKIDRSKLSKTGGVKNHQTAAYILPGALQFVVPI
jgi:hypothetical protein